MALAWSEGTTGELIPGTSWAGWSGGWGVPSQPKDGWGRAGGLPGAEATGAQTHEHGADELAEGGGVDGLQLLLLAVQQVVAVEGAPRQAHALGRLVVVQEPLDLGGRGGGSTGSPPLLRWQWLSVPHLSRPPREPRATAQTRAARARQVAPAPGLLEYQSRGLRGWGREPAPGHQA